MAFCNSCGATLEPGAKFCNKCGSTSPMTGSHPVASAPATQAQSSGALKIILIVVAVIVGLGILGFGTMAFFVHKAIKGTHIEERNGNVKVETPFGTVETTDNAGAAVSNLGVDVYPGAHLVKGSSSSFTMGALHTVSADFESDDPVDKVAEFYKAQLPNTSMVSSQGDQYAIVATDKKKNMITVNIEPQDGKTRIHITNVAGKPPTGSDSTN